MAQLVNAIEEEVRDLTLDMVLFAGDVAYSGKSSEYDEVLTKIVEPLRALPAVKDSLFVAVPGNHDLDCDEGIPLTWSGIGRERQEVFWNSDEAGQKLRMTRSKGFQSYSQFLTRANIAGPEPVCEVGTLVSVRGTRSINLVCLNTALFSDKFLSDDEEKGKSPVPVHTLRQLTTECEPNCETVVVGHHPLNWFEPQSRQHFISTLLEYNAIYLHGHEHRVEPTFGPYAVQTLGFGASYPARLDSKSEQPYTSTFALCELDEKLHIRFISWDTNHGCWRPFHNLPPSIRETSENLPGGYSLPVPTTRVSQISRHRRDFSQQIVSRPVANPPIWIEGDAVESWASLLCDLGMIERPFSTMKENLNQVPTHSRFYVQDANGTHLVHSANAETAVVTYDHVESANTQLDTLQLTSCIIATFGNVTSAAANLASNLKRTKRLEVLDGKIISDRLSNSAMALLPPDFVNNTHDSFSVTPLIVPEGVATLVIDLVRNEWFSILDVSGGLVTDSSGLVRAVREKLPHLRALPVRSEGGLSVTPTVERGAKPFDRVAYLQRCLTVFDTAKYAGLASVGVRLPVESLRRIYVPTSANVQQQQSAINATERAIDDLVETLGLDEHQREQLSRQMKGKYGVQRSSEVSAASRLYQNLSNVAILGDPGSGKSCFVRTEIMSYCVFEDLDSNDWYGKHVPVFLPLAEYTYSHSKPVRIAEQCVSHAKGQGLELDEAQLDELFSRGLVALFLDGLDEVGSIVARQRVLEELTQLVEKYSPVGNRFVLTSRPAAVRDFELPAEFTTVSLLGLTDIEMEILINRLFEARYKEGDQIAKKDRETISEILNNCREKPGIRRLARNPLLLTLLVFIYENSGPFAARRHVIYSQAVKTLVSVRHREIPRAMVSEADLRVRLGKLAVSIFRSEASALPTRSEVLDILEDVILAEQGKDRDFVQDVAETTGLLLLHPRTKKRNEDLVSFMHYSFLEYYTALGFLDYPSGVEMVSHFALNPRWGEVATLMFGIMGDQRDVTGEVKVLCKGHEDSDQITVKRLLLACDCALECDVPPEATQQFLSARIFEVMSSGAGLFVSEVREELASRVQEFLDASGSRYFRQMLLQGLESTEGDVASAFVDLVAKMWVYADGDEEILAKVSKAFGRKERTVRIAIVNAMRNLPSLRTGANLERIGAILRRGGLVEKTAVLQLLDEESALAKFFATELSDLLYRQDGILSLQAANNIVRGGIFQHDDYIDLAMFDRALQTIIGNETPRRSIMGSVEVSWERIENWIYSDDILIRQRGFRCVGLSGSESVKAHDVLFECLKSEAESSVVSTILDVIGANSNVIHAATLAETDLVCRLTRSEYGNVRRSAARALGAFPTMQVVTNSLIERFHRLDGSDVREMRDIVRSIGAHAVRDNSSRLLLTNEMTKILSRRNHRWRMRYIATVTEILSACDQVGVGIDRKNAQALLSLVRNFRAPSEIRRISMRLYGQCCPHDGNSIREITMEFGSSEAPRRLAAYRAGHRLLLRCRARLQTVQVVYDALEEMREELLKCWKNEVAVARERYDTPALREIRSFLVDMESTMTAYREFADRMSVGSFAQGMEESP